MLDRRSHIKQYESAGSSFADLVPWMIMPTSDLVLCKDGSFLACYELDGIDMESLQQVDVDQNIALIEHGMRGFDEHFTIWWTVDRRKSARFPEGGEFPDRISQFINDRWREEYQNGTQYENRHWLSILYNPNDNSSSMRLMDFVAHFVNEGNSVPSAVFQALKHFFLKKEAFSFADDRMTAAIDEFEAKLGGFQQILREARFQRMSGQGILSFLHSRCSPASYGQNVKMPEYPAYLDGYLPSNTLHVGTDSLLFDGNEPVFVAGASVKDWPPLSSSSLLQALLTLPAELTISQCFKYVSRDASKKYIEGIRRVNLNAQKTMLTYIQEAITNQQSDKVDQGKVLAAADANDALTEMTSLGRMYGYYNLTVLAYGSTRLEASETIKAVTGYLENDFFVVVREKLHLLSAWAGTLPGQSSEIVRWHFVSTATMADLSPVRTLAAGDTLNRYLTEQTQRVCPSLTVLSTPLNIPFFFNFHQGDLAHTMVVGPSRTGKSVFLNFLTSQFRKYSPCQVFIFDKDYSCQVPTLLQRGAHIDLVGDDSPQKTTLNPIRLIADRAHWPWIQKWLELLLTQRGYEFDSEDDAKISSAIEKLSKLPADKHVLRSFSTLLGDKLSKQLEQWIGNGAKSQYFDNLVDSFDLGDFTDIEMGGLFHDKRLASAFLDYAFYRIQLKLTGVPTMIYIEEFWFMLSDPLFSARINDWLRTLAKKNAFLVFATQSLDELSSSDIFAAIIDNIPNRIFLPNPSADAHRELYIGKFGLNEEQVERIRKALRKSQYYIVTPSASRMANVQLPSDILACVRSDARARSVFKKHYATRETNPDWDTAYISEMTATS